MVAPLKMPRMAAKTTRSGVTAVNCLIHRPREGRGLGPDDRSLLYLCRNMTVSSFGGRVRRPV